MRATRSDAVPLSLISLAGALAEAGVTRLVLEDAGGRVVELSARTTDLPSALHACLGVWSASDAVTLRGVGADALLVIRLTARDISWTGATPVLNDALAVLRSRWVVA